MYALKLNDKKPLFINSCTDKFSKTLYLGIKNKKYFVYQHYLQHTSQETISERYLPVFIVPHEDVAINRQPSTLNSREQTHKTVALHV